MEFFLTRIILITFFFYFRESTVTQYTYSHPESSLHKRKLDDLKQRIINTPGCHYQIYHIDPQNTMKDEMQKFASWFRRFKKSFTTRMGEAEAPGYL